MENLINETNEQLQKVIDNLKSIGREYEDKLNKNTELIEQEKEKATKYKNDFANAEAKVNKMNQDIEGFENDYNHLVEKFKDDELSNILVAANREISSKIEERKKQILKDQIAMNSLVQKAESVKTKLVKLYGEKKVLEYCYQQIVDAYDYYSTELGKIIDYSNTHREYLCECYGRPIEEVEENEVSNVEETNEDNIESTHEDDIDISIIEDVLDNPVIDDEIEIKLDDDDFSIEDEEYDDVELKNNSDDEEFIYLDNLDLDEDLNFDDMDLRDILSEASKELDEVTDTNKDDLLSYLEITNDDLDKIINNSDDLED